LAAGYRHGAPPLSILWSLYPSDSWIETNRTLAYLAGGGELESARIELSTRLVVRESTAPPREDAGN